MGTRPKLRVAGRRSRAEGGERGESWEGSDRRRTDGRNRPRPLFGDVLFLDHINRKTCRGRASCEAGRQTGRTRNR